MNKKTRTLLKRNALALGLGVFLLSCGTAAASFSPVNVTFGSNNDGDGGFITDTTGDWVWTVEDESLNAFMASTDTNRNATALREIPDMATSDFQLTLNMTVGSLGPSSSNRPALQLFRDDASPNLSPGNQVLVDYRPNTDGGVFRIL